MNGMAIIFDNEGHLLDGHHRLFAVIEADIPVMFDVARGANPDAFVTYDCGRHRTLSQLIQMQGTKNCRLVASIVVANDCLVRRGRMTANMSSSLKGSKENKMSNADKYNLYQKDIEGFNAAAVLANRLRQRANVLSDAWTGGIYYYLTHTGGYTDAEVIPFFEAIFSFDTSRIAIADMLRKILINVKTSGKKLMPEVLWSLIAKSWNHYVNGTTPKKLTYRMADERIPKLIIKSK